MSIKALKSEIDQFLSEIKTSNGGLAEVAASDISDLARILNKLIALKYERDSDGDLPVEFRLVDRTRFERSFSVLVPYVHKPVAGKSELDLNLQAAEQYSLLASQASDASDKHMQAVRRILTDATSVEAPLSLGGRRYVSKPPAGLLPEHVSTALVKRLNSKAMANNPCPVERSHRNVWSAALANKLSAELKTNVQCSMCLITVAGVKLQINVPSLDKVFIAESGSKDVTVREASST